MDGIEYLKNHAWFNSVSLSPTNLMLRFSPSGSGLWIWSGNDVLKGCWTVEDEEFVLPADQQTKLSDGRHLDMIFTPASFENQQKGFRVLYLVDDRWGGYTTNYLGYVALNDTPIEVGEDDVEMIMENGEGKTHGNPQSITQAETPDKITEDGQDEEKSKANMFWLGVVIFHCLLAILWLARKKRKRETKN